MASQASVSLACVVFADTLERRFRAMAAGSEQSLVPAYQQNGMRWQLAADTVALEGRTVDIREFGERLRTVFRERALACPCRCVNSDRGDHERGCGRYVWTRADWAVQQEVSDVAGEE
jgi:hypothetical protein